MNRSTALLFPVVFCVTYLVLYGLKITVVLFYPQVGEVVRRPLPPNSGPAMLYYGWVAASLVAASVAYIVVPERWASRLPANLTWIVPLIAMLYVIYHERGWLFP